MDGIKIDKEKMTMEKENLFYMQQMHYLVEREKLIREMVANIYDDGYYASIGWEERFDYRRKKLFDIAKELFKDDRGAIEKYIFMQEFGLREEDANDVCGYLMDLERIAQGNDEDGLTLDDVM